MTRAVRLALLMMVLAANLFADAVRDAFDPRIRTRVVKPIPIPPPGKAVQA